MAEQTIQVGSAGVRSAIEDAIARERDLWFLYEGGDERTHIRHVRPDHIYQADHPPFASVMVAEDLDRDAPRSFRIDRMREAVVGTGTL